MMPAIISHKLTEWPPLFIQHPNRTLPVRLMVNIDANMRSGMIRYDASHIYGFEMMTRYFPQHFSVAIHKCDIISSTTGQHNTKIFGRGTLPKNASAIKMTFGLIDLF